jgi:hypothetical protein
MFPLRPDHETFMTSRSCAALLLLLCLVLPAQQVFAQDADADATQDASAEPAKDPWASKLSADHPAFSDSAVVLERNHAQVETGFSFSRPGQGPALGGFSVLGRFDIDDGIEARVKIPSIGFNFDDGVSSFINDRFEAGAKVGTKVGDSLRIAAMPYIILPASVNSPYGYLSGSVALLADYIISESMDLTVSLYPRFMSFKRIPGALDQPAQRFAFELDGAVVANFHISHNFSVFVEGWFSYLDIPENSTANAFQPAANAGLIYYLSPDMLLDLTLGARDFTNELIPAATLGFTLRVL